MSKDKCFYCHDTGYISQKGMPDQMCPHCEIGQAVIKGYNKARDFGIQANETLQAANDQLQAKNKELRENITHHALNYRKGKIKELEAENKRLKKAILDFGNNPAGFDWAVLERIEQFETVLQSIQANAFVVSCEDAEAIEALKLMP